MSTGVTISLQIGIAAQEKTPARHHDSMSELEKLISVMAMMRFRSPESIS
jgi:hypothetical protein